MRWLALILWFVTSLVRPAAAELPELAHAGRVTVLGDPGLERTAQQLADSAEHELDAIAADLVDLPVPRHIEVHLVRDASSLSRVAPPGRDAPPWAIGVAYPELGVISVATRRGATLVDPLATLRHELAHVALGAAIGDRAPHWLHEGFAYQHSGEWSMDRSETLAGMVWFGGVIPLDELDRSFPREESPANRAYAESYDFVGFLSRRGRWEDPSDLGDRYPFRRFLTDVGHGKPLDAAAVHAFGRPIHELWNEWRENLSQRYLVAPIGLIGLAVWVLCAVLVTLGWWRRRRQNRHRFDQWDREDLARRFSVERFDDGEPEVATDPDEPEPPPAPPRWIN